MSSRLIHRLFDIVEDEGPGAALDATARFASSFLDPRSRQNRLRLIRLRAGDSTVVRDVYGSKMLLDIEPVTADPMEETLAVAGIREPASTETFHNVLADLERRTDSTVHVFDVGAHIGYFALLEARVLGERAAIYALEPEPRNAARLERNAELNDYAQIDVLQVAAGPERGTTALCVKEKRTAHRMPEAMAGGDHVRTIGVNEYPIDDLIAERRIPEDEPIVVRMDVEGYEGYVFEGMTALLASERPVIAFVELHDRDDDPRATVLDALDAHGFDLAYASYDGGDTVTVPDSYDDVPNARKVHVIASRR